MPSKSRTPLETKDRRAKALPTDEFDDLFERVNAKSNRPLEDRVMFMLSFHAGMRIQEIAGVQWKRNLLDPKGNWLVAHYRLDGGRTAVQRVIDIDGGIVKTQKAVGKSRKVVLSSKLCNALDALYASPGRNRSEYVIPSRQNGAAQDLKRRAHALKMRMNRMYEAMGYEGCSSHTGRRSFITEMAHRISEVGGSLRDVQKMAGHAHLKTTEGYIETTSAQGSLIGRAFG